MSVSNWENFNIHRYTIHFIKDTIKNNENNDEAHTSEFNTTLDSDSDNIKDANDDNIIFFIIFLINHNGRNNSNHDDDDYNNDTSSYYK